MTVRYIPEVTAIFELITVGNNKLTHRKEPPYCKFWNTWFSSKNQKHSILSDFLNLNTISPKINFWRYESIPDSKNINNLME